MELDEKTIKEIKKRYSKINPDKILTDETMGILSQIFKYSNIISKRDYLLENEFITLAKIDLELAEMLYNKGKYSASAWHLQQSTEKAAKAWGLYLSLVTENELKQVSHKSPRVFLNLLDKKIGSLSYQLIKSIKPDYIIEKNALKTFFEKSKEISTLSYDEINKIIELINILSHMIFNELQKYSDLFEEGVVNELMEYMKSLFSIYFLSIITFPHAETTRYPRINKSDTALSPKDYDQNLGIVKATVKIIPFLKMTIDTLSKQLMIKEQSKYIL